MHAHIFTRNAFKRLEKRYKTHVPKLTTDAKGRYWIITNGKPSGPSAPMKEFYDVDARIQLMNKTGVDVQVLSVTPGNFSYEAPAETGRALAAAQNDAIAEVVKAYPDRFIGCATVPLQDVDEAVTELERSVNDLGFTSVEIGSNVMGKSLDSLEFWPFYERAEELRVPIIVHPINNAGADRMERFYLGNIVGNPAETTLAIGSVIFGGVLEQFNGLRFCWAHGGGFFPYQIGRFDHGYQVRNEPKTNILRPPSEYVKSMFFDTITHGEPALRFLVESMGSDKVLFGTDFPWDMGEYDSIESIRRLGLISDNEKSGILGKTSEELFRIGVD